MMHRVESRLSELGIVLPATVAPAANYVPFKKVGSLIYISGQVPSIAGKDQFVGKVGQDLTLADGQQAARVCAINILAQLRQALDGDLDRVISCVRLGGFVNCAPDFGEQPKVINGASDLIVDVFGDIGRHTRAAVGCASLPRNVPVEVDAIFEAN
jgi:enamine deaminase RidA (YjgF/YER057c/UK114 family)